MMQMHAFFLVATAIIQFGGYQAYEFDNRGCSDMMPQLNSLNSSSTTRVGNSGESDGQDAVMDLLQALTPSPYKITLSAPKYRLNRVMKVKIEGGEFNGIFLQARSYKHGTQLGESIIGTFVDISPEIATLDCPSAPHFKVANTAYSKNKKPKKSLELHWQAPPQDVGSVEFTATIIRGNQYWPHVKYIAILANEFPPNLANCGKNSSCYHYSEVTKECKTGICGYLVMSEVVDKDVIFTIGGKIKNPSGYMGIGFTADNKTFSSIDMCLCVKTDSQQVEAAHYMVKNLDSTPEKQNVQMEDADTDVDGEFIWCRFRRALRIKETNAADLTQSLSQLFLWGELDSGSKTPVLPKQDQIARVMGTWNHKQTVNFNYYVGGASILKISWTILFGVLVATLLELYLM